jgi:hypothetical protein
VCAALVFSQLLAASATPLASLLAPSRPSLVGSVSNPTNMNATTVNIVGGYAYVVSKNRNGPNGSNSNDDGTGNSFTILDIASNPAQPAVVGSVQDPVNLFGAYGVAVSGRTHSLPPRDAFRGSLARTRTWATRSS